MNESELEESYKKHFNCYEKLQEDIKEYMYKLKKEFGGIDVAEVKTRPRGSIKELEKIKKNIKHHENKYKDCEKLTDINDIAGVRVICHCEDDWESFSDIVEQRLIRKKEFGDIDRTPKGPDENQGKSRGSYRAIHIDVSRRCQHNEVIFCEIQLRTVMANAWAVQDRKYNYGLEEGERHNITDSVEEVMRGCEGLWSIVKNKYKRKQKEKREKRKLIIKLLKKIIWKKKKF